MADVPKRIEREAAFSAVLSNVFAAHRENALRSPNAVDWQALERESREKIATEILAVYLIMLGMMASSQDVSLVAAEASAASFAQSRGADVAASMTANMRAELSQAWQAASGQAATPAYTEAVERVFSKQRAETIATTETSAAASAGERAAAEEIGELKNIGLTAFWQTEPGACSICEPLHGEPSEVWEDQFPGGPPAHPNCRCWLDWNEV